MDNVRFVTPAEAGRLLGLTADRIRQLCDAGRLPCERTALGRLIDIEQVAALRAARERQRPLPPGFAGDPED